MGFSPTIPQSAAGTRIEPPVSVPMDAKPMPIATAAADPPLEPPEIAIERPGIPHRAEMRVLRVMP